MSRFRLGFAAVVMLVLLRMAIGWHFLYEGIWKLENSGFSSEGFWRQARGPLADYFHRLVPDYDGRQRLDAKTVSDRWAARRDELIRDYQLSEEQQAAAGKIYNRYDAQLSAYLTENKEDIVKYLAGLDELAKAREEPAARQVPYQLKRLSDKENSLRAQSRPWLEYVDSLDAGYEQELVAVLDKDQLARRPLTRERTLLDKIDLATAYGLTAIGACLLAGLFSRLANVAGAVFLALVVLAQPAFPGVFPAAPPTAGHSLFVNKEFVEMIAMLALACTPVGCWGGLDFFVHHFVVRPIFGRRKTDAPNT